MAQHILVVDDDPHIREVICFALEQSGMVTDVAVDGADALRAFEKNAPDLIVLDVGMPEKDGLDVCKEIRKTSDVPILFLSAKDEEIDRILGLEMGGDDYVTKPFSPRELIARIKAILKRLKVPTPPKQTEDVLTFGGIRLDPLEHRVEFEKALVTLTAIEFSILKAFLKRPTFVFSRDQIIEFAYNANMHVSDRTIDSHIRNIRAKFAQNGCPSVVDTVHGVGFRLGACEARS